MAKMLVYDKRKTVRFIEQRVSHLVSIGRKNSQIFNYKLILLNHS